VRVFQQRWAWRETAVALREATKEVRNDDGSFALGVNLHGKMRWKKGGEGRASLWGRGIWLEHLEEQEGGDGGGERTGQVEGMGRRICL